MRKTILQQRYSWSVQKTAPKNTKYSRNETIFKTGHLAKAIAHAKAIAFAKIIIFGQKLKIKKNMRTTILQQHCSWSVQKNRSKKHQLFEKRDHLQNWPSCQGYSPCKGYSLCKIGHFGSKLNNAKHMRKTILQQHYSCSVQKTAL